MLLNPDLDNQLKDIIFSCGIQPVPEVYAAYFSVVVNMKFELLHIISSLIFIIIVSTNKFSITLIFVLEIFLQMIVSGTRVLLSVKYEH